MQHIRALQLAPQAAGRDGEAAVLSRAGRPTNPTHREAPFTSTSAMVAIINVWQQLSGVLNLNVFRQGENPSGSNSCSQWVCKGHVTRLGHTAV